MENNNSNTNTILIVVVLLILVGALVWFFAQGGISAPAEDQNDTGVGIEATLPSGEDNNETQN